MSDVRAPMSPRETLTAALAEAVAANPMHEATDAYGPFVAAFGLANLPNTRFELRSIAVAPESMVAIMYRKAGGHYRQCGVGFTRNGQWRPEKGKPYEGEVFWALMVADG